VKKASGKEKGKVGKKLWRKNKRIEKERKGRLKDKGIATKFCPNVTCTWGEKGSRAASNEGKDTKRRCGCPATGLWCQIGQGWAQTLFGKTKTQKGTGLHGGR